MTIKIWKILSSPIVLLVAMAIVFFFIFFDIKWTEKSTIAPSVETSLNYINFPDNEFPREDMVKESPPVFYTEFDGYPIVKNAQRMVENGTFRTRWVDWDNVPFGRTSRWGSLFQWWLVFLGYINSIFSGKNISSAIVSASFYANPILLAMFIIVLAGALYSKIKGPAAFLIILCLTSPYIINDFRYASPDHHGLQLIFAMGTLLSLYIGGGGWVRHDGREKKWFLVSAIFGGLGMWESSIQQTVLVSGLGLGALLAVFLSVSHEKSDPEMEFSPELWRLWCWAGSAVSLIAYFIEYFPKDLDMRIEFNHPLYAISWLCGGEIIYRVGLWKKGLTRLSISEVIKLLLYFAGVIALYLAIIYGPVKWFAVKDSFVSNLYFYIEELQSFFSTQGNPSFMGILREIGLLIIPPFLLGISLFFGRFSRQEKSLFIIALTPVLFLMLFFFMQIRWGGFFAIASVSAFSIFFLKSKDDKPMLFKFHPISIGVLAAILIFNFFNQSTSLYKAIDNLEKVKIFNINMSARHLALNLIYYNKKEKKNTEIRVMAGPYESSSLYFFCPCKVTGSFYWENIEGIKDMVDFYAAYDDEEAYKIVKKRDIDYVITRDNHEYSFLMHFYKYKNMDSSHVEKTMGYKLGNSSSSPKPSWLEPVTLYGLPPSLKWRMYRVIHQNEK